MNKNGFSTVILVVVGLVVASIFIIANMALANNDSPEDADFAKKQKVSCIVTVDADAFSDTDIESVSCVKRGKCGIFAGLSFITTEGNLQLVDPSGDKFAEESYKLRFSGSAQKEITGCTFFDTFTVRLMENGDIKDSREVSV